MESSSRMSESEQNIAPFHHGTYHMLAEIGKGSFARVMKARHADSGQIFAIKMVKKKRLNNKLTANLQTEIQIMKNTRHPGIIRLYESYDTEGHVNLVMEYCKLGDMSRIIKHAGKLSTIPGLQEMDRRHHSYPKALNPMIVRLFARQLIDAIRFLHRRNLIHRDIKPQNILLDIEDVSNMSSERQVVLESLAKAIGVNVNAWRWLPLVKLADFGFARHLPSTSLAETLCGSPLYMGPEILRYERYDAKADLWSLGAVVFEMLTGKPPFRAKNHIELLRRIDTTVLEFPKPAINYPDGSDYPKDLQRFILGLLKKTPVERMSFETAFNHDAMSPPMYNPYPVGYTPPAAPGLITDGRNSGESQYNETRVAQMIEDYANRSDCIWSFAEIKFQQLMPESASSDVGSNSSKLADELSDLTDDAIVILSEEALLLYVKALGILATAIDFASQWWLRHSRLGDGPPHTTDRINATVQWLRNRFNDTLEKVEHVRLRLIQAQERLPEDHPAHPSHHAEDGAMSIGSGNLNVYISSRITADKLIYDRALEMCKHAAGDEMCKRNLSVCETYYSTALRMMEALLDRTDDNRSTNSEGGGDGEFDQQQEEDQQHLEKMIHAIRGRLLATQQKMQSINENEKLYRAGAHRRSGSNTPVSVVSN
ncbi:Serine/threonine-protein kinase ATG1 [Ceratocystis platani]|uniref:non-specific serine/threonine protein kinase n=1 Tax=Ceratocystis fimbriata f. sp. platani TaxID=88771 RepID=A0A0F8B0T8_CERFI|nr:Serine/threonine-protein kinase ATG1 [Ceratocystis platani]